MSLGSNLGDRESYIAAMERGLRAVLYDMTTSPLMETEPVGAGGDHPPYLNKIVAGYYNDTPRSLLAACQSIENELARARPFPKAPRTADIDILIFGDMVIDEADLIIPHPEIMNRRFCLEGLLRIDPKITIPQLGAVNKLYEYMNATVNAQNVYFIKSADQ